MILILTFLVADIKPSQAIDIRAGEPVPGADVLDQILVNNQVINSSDTNDGSLFDFLFGDGNSASEKLNSDNLDISVLDYINVHKIVEVAKKNYESRRQYPTYWRLQHEANRPNQFFVNKAFDLMKQSIYATRFRLERTRPIRKRFQSDVSYNIAIMYGSMSQLILKMDSMYGQMFNLPYRTHFIWFLIFYEKILAAHVDIESMVHRMFEFQKIWVTDTRSDDHKIDILGTTIS